MIHEITQKDLAWLNLTAPTISELEDIARRLGIEPNVVLHCLEPKHFPKFEEHGSARLLILRSFDHLALDTSETVQSMTHKLVFFMSSNLLVTISRKPHDFVENLFLSSSGQNAKPLDLAKIIYDIIQDVQTTYQKAASQLYESFDDFESEIFKNNPDLSLKRGYFFKRRISVMRRMIRLTIEALDVYFKSMPSDYKGKNLVKQDQRMLTGLEELSDNTSNLLSLQISLISQRTNTASHKTNEVMRVLTIFSVLFMPLNLIAGIYGMNFEFMPELKMHYAYPVVLGSMLFVALTVFLWLKKLGWVERDDLPRLL